MPKRTGHLSPRRKKRPYTCPRCWGEGTCPSWNGEGYPPNCEGCNGDGMVTKEVYDEIIEDGFDTDSLFYSINT